MDSPCESRPPLRQSVQPHASPLKVPVAGTSWKSEANWEQLTGANGVLEVFISSSPRNPYLICIYTGIVEESKNGATQNAVQTHPIPDSQSNSHLTVTTRNCRISGEQMTKKVDRRKKDRCRYRAGERDKLSGCDLMVQCFFWTLESVGQLMIQQRIIQENAVLHLCSQHATSKLVPSQSHFYFEGQSSR